MMHLKANTAVTLRVGPFVDDQDGYSPETGLTIVQADIRLSKNGGNFAQTANASGATHDEVGWYSLSLTTGDTDTEGTLVLQIDESGALPVWKEFMVLSEAAYDSLYTAKDTGYMDVNIKAVSDGTTAPDNMEIVFETDFATNYNQTRDAWVTNAQDFIGTTAADPFGGYIVAASVTGNVGGNVTGSVGEVSGVTFPTNFGDLSISVTTGLVDITQTAADKAWGTAARTVTAATNITSTGGTTVPQTGDSFALANGATGFVAIDTVVDAVKAVTDNLPDSGALTTIGTDTARLTAVRAAVLTDWINGGRLDLLLDAIKAVTDNLPDSGALTTIGTDTARLTAARAAVLTDWIDGGRLDLLLDAIPTTAMRGTDNAATAASLATAQTSLDAIEADTGTDGVKLNSTQPAGWAANLAASAAQIIKATVDTAVNGHTPTTTIFQADDITEPIADHYNGRIVVFTSGNLAGQASDITDYEAVGGIGQFTVTALTGPPANNDTFVIV
jgi:hypothetical protein